MINRMNNIVRQRQNAVSNSRRREMGQKYSEKNEENKKSQPNQGSVPHYNPLISDKK